MFSGRRLQDMVPYFLRLVGQWILVHAYTFAFGHYFNVLVVSSSYCLVSWSLEEYENLHWLLHGYVSVHSALLGPTADTFTCVVFAAALEATTVSVCVLPRIGTTTLVVSRPTGSPDASGFRAYSTCENGVAPLGVIEVVGAVTGCSLLATRCSQLMLTSGGFRVELHELHAVQWHARFLWL